MDLKIQRLDPHLPLPAHARPGDAGMDLRARTDVVLQPGQRALIPTGIAIAVPAGWAGFVNPRSGLAAKHGITVVNAPGTVDSGYRGEIKVTLLNTDLTEAFEISRGDRIAQLVLQRVAVVDVVEVDQLDETERGRQGFGSSGRD
ncbi:dUTP diphosphatase [Kocuria coralli]|uniref:Deoxyuridine 5'-triphosphate nucleotidohydrolase n=1 Tax=Kocuria coralli TaxID=1461025 RepID=A0A5J5KV52_9MICC|nr:dUTP diphosphatase [Kocuria coralli]